MKRIAWMLLLSFSVCGGAAIPNCQHWVQRHFTHPRTSVHKHHTAATLKRWRIYNLNETLKRYQLACGDATPISTEDVQTFIPIMDGEMPIFTIQPDDEVPTVDDMLSSLIPTQEIAANGYPYYSPTFFPFMPYLPPSNPPYPVPEIPAVAMVVTGLLFASWRKYCS